MVPRFEHAFSDRKYPVAAANGGADCCQRMGVVITDNDVLVRFYVGGLRPCGLP